MALQDFERACACVRAQSANAPKSERGASKDVAGSTRERLKFVSNCKSSFLFHFCFKEPLKNVLI